MSNKEIRINKKVVITGCVIEVILIIAILFSIFYVDPTYSSYLSKGQEQLNGKQYEEAMESFEKALEIYPSGVDAVVGQSDAYIGLEEYDQAISKLEEALSIASDDPAIYNKLITACVLDEDIDKANDTIMGYVQTGLSTDEITSVKPAPTITPNGGTFKKAITVTIDENEDGTVYYTTDGETPTIDDKKYKKPFKLDKRGEYRVVAMIIQEDGMIGFPATNSYILDIAETERAEDGINYNNYLGSWTDGETTLSITDVDGSDIKFSIKLSWVDEVITTSSSGKAANGIISFSYKDNWGNKGTGVLTFGDSSIHVKMREKESTGATVPGFGSYATVLYK